MKIEHVAIWVRNLDKMKKFYEKYFGLQASEKYTNPRKQFSSYFLSFPASETRIEIMQQDTMQEPEQQGLPHFGLAHVAIAVGSEEQVNALTEQLRKDGFEVLGEPRTTGDGYYESVVADCEGNPIEITV